MNKPGISINKLEASTTLKILKKANLYDTSFKVKKLENKVVIPLISTNRMNVKNILNEIPHKITTVDFEKVDKKSATIREYLVSVLPSEQHQDIPTSYDKIGDLVIVEVKPTLIPFSKIIAEGIILVANAKAVFRKTTAVKGLFRIRQLHHIGGQYLNTTIHTEFGIRIFVDILNVFFSPRFAQEHYRIASQIEENESILDLFTGTGGFALLIACMKKCNITAIDMNPYAILCLNKSLRLNKNLRGKIDSHEVDARVFQSCQKFDRIIMNHPSLAIQFLNVATINLKKGGWLHIYTFLPTIEISTLNKRKRHKFFSNYQIIKIRKVKTYSKNQALVAIDAKKL